MARPQKQGNVHRLQVTLCLWEGEDDDLIAHLVHGDIPPRQRAQAVIAAMRQGIGGAGFADGEVNEGEAAAALIDGLLF